MNRSIQRAALLLTLIMLTVPMMASATATISDDDRGAATESALVTRSVLRVNNDSDLVALKASGNCTGNGTESDPYIIEDFEIDADGQGNAMFIGNITVHLVVRNCSLHGASWISDPYFDGSAITLYDCCNVTLSGNTCSGSVSGVRLQGSDDNALTNNTCITNDECGIYLNGSGSNSISGNNCSDNVLDGIRMDLSDGNLLTSNVCNFNPTYDGIYLNRSHGNTLADNICNGNGHTNIYLERSDDNILLNNTCDDSVTYYGICVETSSGNTLTNNTCAGNGWYGIFLTAADNNTVQSNTCWNSGYSGIYLNCSVNNTLTENRCHENNDGLYLYTSSYNQVAENICVSNTNYSIYLKNCSDHNEVRGNICNGSDRYGLYLNVSCADNLVSGNLCGGDRTGIHLNNSCHDNTLTNNTCGSSGLYGIWLKGSNGNQVMNNTCEASASYGIYVTGSDDNVIIGNVMTDNNGADGSYDLGHVQAFDDGTNDWNTAYGNLWSDWLGPDADANGIVDSSYELDGEMVSQDFRPLSTKVSVTSHTSGTYVQDLNITVGGTSVCYFGVASVVWRNAGTGSDGACNGTTSWNATVPLAVGTNEITFIMTDSGGRTVSTFLSVFVDVTAPSVNITSPMNGSYQSSSVVISWNATDAGSGVALAEVSSDGANWTSVSGSSATINGLKDGNWTLYVRVTDAVGNVNTTQINVTVDAYAPSLLILSPEDGYLNGTGSVTVSWNGTDDGTGTSHYAVNVDGDDWTVVNGTERTFTLADGERTISVRAYDLVGNYAEANVTVIIDTTAPTLAITTPTNGSYVNTTNVTVTWSGSDATSISHYEARIDSGDWTTLNGTNITFLGLADGLHNVSVRAYDLLNNMKEVGSAFRIDTVVPTLNITSPSNGTLSASSSLTLRWDAGDDTNISYQQVKLDNGTWTYIPLRDWYELTGLRDGTHTIGVRIIDIAGNQATMFISVVIDTTAPTAVVSPTGSGVEVNSSIVITFSEPMNTTSVVVQMVGADNMSISWNGTVATCDPGALLFNSTYTVVVTGTDLAGNEIARSWTFKTIKPGQVQGVVVDENGNPIVNALIVLSNNRTATTGSDGHFVITNITHGAYNGTIMFEGQTFSFNVTVVAGETSDLGQMVMVSVADGDDLTLPFVGILAASIAVLVVAIYVLRKRRVGGKG